MADVELARSRKQRLQLYARVEPIRRLVRVQRETLSARVPGGRGGLP